MIPSYLRLHRRPSSFLTRVVTYAAFQLCRRLLRGVYS